ncbi:UDP-2,3-diacylglucosamine diphosphatase [Vreelandella malpeensis]|uniref:UDP-2,3-diacylglucosamine hydrolase n=1 Tax=Vreelandella malpeensis TaxID=1172368 RepID=A0ABS8DWN6_9GAMM|nr:UDP-2,3-diacylglucosamine diphosphatase [Halomonas malpeensis]MCB8890701.1 UDP-2,3-diacylglucosamine diphosphatase [Halomonas malpeensis]
MRTLLVADTHLSGDTPKINQGFYRYLEHTAPGADALYILGDLFDAWIGDDVLDTPHPIATVAHEVITRLSALSDGGTRVYFQHGNRDFLLGERFLAACGAEALPEVHEVELEGLPVVLLHGDSLCTRDEPYMAFRAQSRSREWQAQILAMPLQDRLALAGKLRLESSSANADKAQAIMDVTEAEVIALMHQLGVSVMIHGHTHRPQVHTLSVEDVPAKRFVLGDWSESHGFDIVVERHDGRTPEPELRRFELASPPAAD